ncbi:reverse transcriptase [Gossypium australe]|uniref:Reverse transcriptase n=1 Tax=Gossypium australe TaxID=47621 RepID=A0A5B6VNG6_9ROSI|nr:reverse transcriptase [Gossypium australe]
MVTLFHDMIRKEIELKLNPAKCTFGATSGKLLGSVVSEKGIKIDPDKKTLNKVKHYLSNASVLIPPNTDKPLILYLEFTECETRHSLIEKLCCTLIWTTRRLRQYMLYHTIWLISKLDPLKYIMESIALNGRMARWQILLSEFDIIYVNQKAVKGSAIANFLASRALEDYEPLNFNFLNENLIYVTIEEGTPEEYLWKLNFD